jgi:hypothetical protein
MKLKIIIVTSVILTLVSSCSMSRRTSGFYDFPIECLGTESDGSHTLLVMSDGRNRLDAIEQAKKDAVRCVMLKGVTAGKQTCDPRPLIPEVNADRKYENYFAAFFTDGGAYSQFVGVQDERVWNKILRDRMKGRKQVKNSVVCRVQTLKLKEKLKTDNIIK